SDLRLSRLHRHVVRGAAVAAQAAGRMTVGRLGAGVARLATLAYRTATAPPPVTPGRLLFEGDARPGAWRLGPFEVVLGPDRLVVKHPRSPGGVAWTSPPPGAFAASARGHGRFCAGAGHLGADERVRQRLAAPVASDSTHA